MRKQMEESAAAEGARRATGAAAGRGRGERFSARRKRAVVLRLLRRKAGPRHPAREQKKRSGIYR